MNNLITRAIGLMEKIPQSLIAFTRNFGELDNYGSQPFNRHPEYDEVMLLSNKPVNG